MPTNPDVPMSREELRKKIVALLENYYHLKHRHCSEDCSTKHTELREIDDWIYLINQEKREMIERMPRHKHIPCEWNKCIDTIQDQLEQEK